MTPATISAEQHIQQTAISVAHEYLKTVKRWNLDDYRLEVCVCGTDKAPIVVVDCVYKADLLTPQCGGGQSVQLHVDVQKQMVIRELGYQ